jgi:hypothetical protein
MKTDLQDFRKEQLSNTKLSELNATLTLEITTLKAAL